MELSDSMKNIREVYEEIKKITPGIKVLFTMWIILRTISMGLSKNGLNLY
jgi:hypothetical protein